jgi:hypothetical protein
VSLPSLLTFLDLDMKSNIADNCKFSLSQLDQFTGSAQYHRYSPLFPNFWLTDGALFLAEKAGCFWLFDQLASLQAHSAIQNHPQLESMQFWYLTVNADASALLSCEWDKGKIVYEEKIVYTDFPLPLISIWVGATTVGDRSGFVALLPSEY